MTLVFLKCRVLVVVFVVSYYVMWSLVFHTVSISKELAKCDCRWLSAIRRFCVLTDRVWQ